MLPDQMDGLGIELIIVGTETGVDETRELDAYEASTVPHPYIPQMLIRQKVLGQVSNYGILVLS